MDAVKPMLADAAEKVASEDMISSNYVTELQKAVESLKAVVPNSQKLAERIADAQILADSTYAVEEVSEMEYGDVTIAQKEAFTQAIETATQAMQLESKPTPASLEAAYDALNKAYWTLNAQRKTFEVGKWYYLISTEYQGYHVRDNYAWRGNQMIYACGANAQAPIQAGKMTLSSC